MAAFIVLPSPLSITQICHMANELHNINAEAEAEMLKWVQHFIAQRKAALLRGGKKGVASGDLLRSFEIEMSRKANEEGIALLMSFDDSMRFLDMKPKSFSYDAWGREAIHRLQKWIGKRGIGGFSAKYLRKNPNFGSRKGFNMQRMVSDIAWGIAISRQKGNFRRGKSVWNKAKTAGIYELINNVAAALPAPTADTIKNQFK